MGRLLSLQVTNENTSLEIGVGSKLKIMWILN
jgi:hypothetical protein